MFIAQRRRCIISPLTLILPRECNIFSFSFTVFSDKTPFFPTTFLALLS